MSGENKREKFINKFVHRVARLKEKGMSEQVALLKLKIAVRKSNQLWTKNLNELFKSTWDKKLTPEEEKELNSPSSQIRIKPNKNWDEDAEGPKLKIKPNKRKYTQEKDRLQNTEDDLAFVDSPIWDEPEFQIKTTKRKCMGENCGATFIQSPSYPNRMLCPECNEKALDSISHGNWAYASDSVYQKAFERRLANITVP